MNWQIITRNKMQSFQLLIVFVVIDAFSFFYLLNNFILSIGQNLEISYDYKNYSVGVN